jgi:hypothetical protein
VQELQGQLSSTIRNLLSSALGDLLGVDVAEQAADELDDQGTTAAAVQAVMGVKQGAKGSIAPTTAAATAAGLLQSGPGVLPSGEGLMSKLRGAAQGAKRQAVSQMRGCVMKQGGPLCAPCGHAVTLYGQTRPETGLALTAQSCCYLSVCSLLQYCVVCYQLSHICTFACLSSCS